MVSDANTPVLSIYDFRSKQEFIYRTNRMREITGASELIAGMYAKFLTVQIPDEDGNPMSIRSKDWRDGDDALPIQEEGEEPFFLDEEYGIVVYEGGGNLCILFRNRGLCRAANRVFSRMVIESGYSLGLIAGSADWEETGSVDGNFQRARKLAYRALDRNKRVGSAALASNALSFTQTDAVTFQPIVQKQSRGTDLLSCTQESVCKLAAYDRKAKTQLPNGKVVDTKWGLQGKHVDEIGTQKDDDSLIAVVYFDGNSIGDRLTSRVHSVEDMREFSKEVHEVLVTNTERAMRGAIEAMPDERQRGYRIIIDHGDEITLICNAHAAPVAIQAYFASLEASNEERREKPGFLPYHACAGMAVCHSHDPFSEVYRIAEECCASGKERNRAVMRDGGTQGSYVDFHYCRSGITGTLRQIRSVQEARIINRPYRVGESYQQFLNVGSILSKGSAISKDDADTVRRADLKSLARAILRGDSHYALEYERMKAKDTSALRAVERELLGDRSLSSWEGLVFMRNTLFDVASFADVFDVLFDEMRDGGAHE